LRPHTQRRGSDVNNNQRLSAQTSQFHVVGPDSCSPGKKSASRRNDNKTQEHYEHFNTPQAHAKEKRDGSFRSDSREKCLWMRFSARIFFVCQRKSLLQEDSSYEHPSLFVPNNGVLHAFLCVCVVLCLRLCLYVFMYVRMSTNMLSLCLGSRLYSCTHVCCVLPCVCMPCRYLSVFLSESLCVYARADCLLVARSALAVFIKCQCVRRFRSSLRAASHPWLLARIAAAPVLRGKTPKR